MKIVVFTTPDYTKPVLDALINAGHQIVSIIRKSESLDTLPDCDLCIVAAYGKIIPKRYLDLPKFGFLNIHPSLLPKYRGPSPIKSAILNGDTETGVTIMKVDEEMDHGPIVASSKYQLLNSKSHLEIQKEMWDLGAKLLVDTLPEYVSGEIKPKAQDHSQATFTKKFTREDGKINWSQTAEEIFNKIRALGDEPGTWTMWNGKILNIKSADILNLKPKEKVKTTAKINGHIAVATGKCYLILKTIQLEGRKETDAKSFANGHPNFISSKLEQIIDNEV